MPSNTGTASKSTLPRCSTRDCGDNALSPSTNPACNPVWIRDFSRRRHSEDSTPLFLLCSIYCMADRPASWRMPTSKQMEKLASAAARKPACMPGEPAGAPQEALPPEYWQSVLSDPRAASNGLQTRQRALSEIQRHLLRVSCRRCGRTVEIQTADAVRLYGPDAAWKDVGQRLLDDTCQVRTGRHEEDGCWPSFESSPARRRSASP
jgi:hypothetical protein